MPSKIIFLGTGGDSVVVGKQMRASGGIIIQDGEVQLHIDPGPGSLVRAAMYEVNIRGNTAILVSSSDFIASGDVNNVIDAMTYSGLDKGGVLAGSSTVINGNEKQTPLLTSRAKDYLEKYIILVPGQKLAIENIEVHATPAFSEDLNSMGFKIFTTESVIGYTANTKYSKELAAAYKGCDILIVNLLAPGSEKVENRLNTEDAAKLIQQVSPQLAIIRNFGAKIVKSDPINEGREIQRITGVQTIAAKDGMSLAPNSYSAKSKQKRLNLYPANEPAKTESSFQSEQAEVTEIKDVLKDLEKQP